MTARLDLPAESGDQRRQFNVQLPASLIRRIKIAAIDGDQSLARFVQEALEAQLGPDPASRPRTPDRSIPDQREPGEHP